MLSLVGPHDTTDDAPDHTPLGRLPLTSVTDGDEPDGAHWNDVGMPFELATCVPVKPPENVTSTDPDDLSRLATATTTRPSARVVGCRTRTSVTTTPRFAVTVVGHADDSPHDTEPADQNTTCVTTTDAVPLCASDCTACAKLLFDATTTDDVTAAAVDAEAVDAVAGTTT